MSEQLKIGLIGAGVFAGYHANKLAAHSRTDFIGVYDKDDARARELAAKHLIEKPLATTAKEVDVLLSLASAQSLIIQVGHQERLVFRTIGLEAVSERPSKIEAVRNSAYSPRGTDTSVTLDLMTHDIDLCTVLMESSPDHLEGVTQVRRA